MIIAFEVLGKPEPEPRTKVRGNHRGVYTPTSAHAWKRAIRRAYADAAGPASQPAPSDVPIAASFTFRFARPQDHYRTGKHAGELKPWAKALEHLTTPDLDNLIKAAKDCLGAWGKLPRRLPPLAYINDSQVCRYVGDPEKRYVRPGESPGLSMVIHNPYRR